METKPWAKFGNRIVVEVKGLGTSNILLENERTQKVSANDFRAPGKD
jgi:hypothetical protein